MPHPTVERPASALRQRMLEDMAMRSLREATQRDYIRFVRAFAAFLGHSPDTASAEDLRRFQIHQAKIGVQAPTINGSVSALRFLFTVTLDRPDLARRLVLARYGRKLPTVLSAEEVGRLLEAAPGPKYRAALGTAYGAGLRVSDVATLKIDDIDSIWMLIRIEEGTLPRLQARDPGPLRRFQAHVEAHLLGRLAAHPGTRGPSTLRDARCSAPGGHGHANSGVPVKVGMALTAHKTVTMFMRYVHTEDDPIRQAAETVASRRCTVVQGGASPIEGSFEKKPLENPAAAAATSVPRSVKAIVDRRSASTGLGNYRPYRNRKGEYRPAPPKSACRVAQAEEAEHV